MQPSPESDQRPNIMPVGERRGIVCHPIVWPATSLQPLPMAAETSRTKQSIIKADIFQRPTAFMR
jgi:hypothetical protein